MISKHLLFAVVLAAAVSAQAQTAQALHNRPRAGFEVSVLPAPDSGNGTETTGEVSAMLLTDKSGRVRDTLWTGDNALVALAKQQKLPAKTKPVRQCRPVAGGGTRTVCKNVPAYFEHLFVFANKTGTYRYRRSSQLRRPHYPEASLEQGEQGMVKVRVTVNPKGQIVRKQLSQSSGFERLDSAALKMVENSTILPAIRDGRPLFTEYTIPVNFSLLDEENSGQNQSPP